jgi:hypothetical protein
MTSRLAAISSSVIVTRSTSGRRITRLVNRARLKVPPAACHSASSMRVMGAV